MKTLRMPNKERKFAAQTGSFSGPRYIAASWLPVSGIWFSCGGRDGLNDAIALAHQVRKPGESVAVFENVLCWQFCRPVVILAASEHQMALWHRLKLIEEGMRK